MLARWAGMPHPPRGALAASSLVVVALAAAGCGRDYAQSKNAGKAGSGTPQSTQSPKDRAAANRAAMRSCAPPPDDLAGALRGGLAAQRVEQATLDSLKEAAPSAEAFAIQDGGVTVASVVAFPVRAGEDAPYAKGVVTGARRTGDVAVRAGTVGGAAATRIDLAGGETLYLVRRGCRMLQIKAGSAGRAKGVAVQLADQP